jgi:D-alanyl-D-alanine carboxypeptidase
MWKPKLKSLRHFGTFLQNLSFPDKMLAAFCFTVALLYPGQNYYQTLVIHPGPIRSYAIPDFPTSLYPVNDGTAAPVLTARSVVAQDVDSKSLVYTKNPDTALMPASTTKIMTALVALDHYKLTDQIMVKNEDRAIGSSMKLVKGEVITVENVLYGLLVDSGNDAALALADNYPGGYDKFLNDMNTKASMLNLEHTTYRNVSGVESYGHMTTARDLATLAAVAVKNPVVSRIMQTKNITVTDVGGTIVHQLVSTNELLGVVPGLKGLKTGWTENAGECLVSYVERNGHNVVVVVLNSTDRFGESARLIEWVYAHHAWQPID